MSSEINNQPISKETSILPADGLIKTSKPGDTVLDEKELERVCGGASHCCTGQHFKKAVLTVR